MTSDSGRVMTVRGESLGGGKVRITRINQVEVDFSGEYNTLIVIQRDRQGVIAHITDCLTANSQVSPMPRRTFDGTRTDRLQHCGI